MRICQPPEKVSAGLAKSVFAKPEPFEHLRHPQFDAVALFAPEEIGQVVVPHEQTLVFAVRQVRIRQGVFDPVDLRAGLEQRPEGERRLVDQAAPGVVQAVLRQVADGQAGRLDDRAAIGLVEPGQDAEQSGLAGAVRPAEADAIAVADRPGHRVEQDAFAECLGEIGELDHADEPRDVLRHSG